MTFNADHHHRRSIRLRGYDYSRAGAYFVTICTRHRACLFGDVIDGVMVLNDAGRSVADVWRAIPDHFSHATVDAFVVMPNHVHGVLLFTLPIVGAQHAAPVPAPLPISAPRVPRVVPGSVGAVVRSFKSAATQQINVMRSTPGVPVWQRNYYEHIIRDDDELHRIRQYIADNPRHWPIDHENPHANTPVGHQFHDEWHQ